MTYEENYRPGEDYEESYATDERILDGELLPSDENENILRPTTLDEYVGQDKIKDNLRIFIQAARKRGEALDHVLLYGPPGLGKTTLSKIIANEMGVEIKSTSGPAIERSADLVANLTALPANSVMFIDEIHRLNHTAEELLYPAMEDFNVDFMLGQEQLGLIVRRSASILNIDIQDAACIEIASRSRGTPRIANRLLKRVRDFAECENSAITLDIAKKALNRLEVDALGLDHTDRTILHTIIDKFDGGPVGLDTLAAATGEESATIEDVYEPFLMQLGFVARTPRGRICSRRAYEHLKIPYRVTADSTLFDWQDNGEDKGE